MGYFTYLRLSDYTNTGIMRGILMIEPLYHQTIAGKKTQTRRSGGLELVNKNPDDWELTSLIMFGQEFTKEQFLGKMGVRGDVHGLEFKFTNKNTREIVIRQPRYKVGEVLYIKEPYIIMGGEPIYKYDLDLQDGGRKFVKWSNKLFMGAKDARAYVKITGIKCERLMDISEDDCIAEGIERVGEWTSLPVYKNYLLGNTNEQQNHYKLDGTKGFWNDAKLSFISLYKFANKAKEVPNLWVWVYSFEYLKEYKP